MLFVKLGLFYAIFVVDKYGNPVYEDGRPILFTLLDDMTEGLDQVQSNQVFARLDLYWDGKWHSYPRSVLSVEKA
jgi:hypothetical protein